MTAIFIVEDDLDLSEIYQALLERAGMEVEVSRDGLDATQRILAGSKAPDGVILDLHLPGLSGYQVFEQIRQRWPEIKVLVMTADEVLAAALEAQMLEARPVCVLIKPVPMADLVSVVRKYTEAGEA